MGHFICTELWSPTSVARTAIALTVPLPLVRFLMSIRALDLDAAVGEDPYPQHTALMVAVVIPDN